MESKSSLIDMHIYIHFKTVDDIDTFLVIVHDFSQVSARDSGLTIPGK